MTLEEELRLEEAALALVRRLLACTHVLVMAGTCHSCGARRDEYGRFWPVDLLAAAADSGAFRESK
jgi:hypothetical protein